MGKTALITGITGQDGAYLTKLLLEKDYRVYGAFRRNSSANFWRLEDLGLVGQEGFDLCEFDLTDPGGAIRLIDRTQPDEVYNLAAQSFVKVSFDQPVTTAEITGLGVLHLLEAIRIVNPQIRFYQASTSELFGEAQEMPQTERTPFHPRSPYGVAKLFAHWSTINYRESYGIFGCCGILFNHESPLRGLEFVTRKITHAVARIALGQQDGLVLGNLSARRDWGYAPEYVDGMYRMMQQSVPDTYVLATNRAATIREFAELAFKAIGIEIHWSGEGVAERGIDDASGRVLVRVSEDFFRPAEVDVLRGDPSKAYRELGWKAETSLEEMCALMVASDLQRVERGFAF